MGDHAAGLLKVLFPHLSQVVINSIGRMGKSVRIAAICTASTAWCPGCGTVSARVHSRYGRRLADTAVSGQETAIDLEVRRFFCDNADCAKRTFAEQIENLTFRYGRRTMTQQRALQQVALALGGQAGERLTERLATPVSGPTLLRLIRSMDIPEVPELTVLGVDEFAFRRVIYSRPQGVLHVVHELVGLGDLRGGSGYLRPSITQNSGRDHAGSARRVVGDTAGVVDGAR
ncbi:transposase family protein [Streptomyces sp. NPDC094438]|uniref:transposase family protein n=1 Tax=Streptomyces sp. NPDC094438 TaxID=3366061 RepID=UPI00382B202D